MQNDLMPCPTCRKNMSIAASSCPHCGHPIDESVRAKAREEQRVQLIAKEREKKIKRWIIGAVCVACFLWSFFEKPKPKDWADHLRPDAVPKCSRAIEAHAQYGFEWQSLALEYFPRFPYVNSVREHGDERVLFMGNSGKNALLFKNSFGVMVPMEYQCLYDVQSKSVVEVRVSPRQ